jgi:hypothetical protein
MVWRESRHLPQRVGRWAIREFGQLFSGDLLASWTRPRGVLFLDPHGEGKSPGKQNFCATDNLPLAGYLKDSFLSHFAMFRGVPAISNFRFEKGSEFIPSGDAKTTYTERFRSETGEVALTWEPLSDSFMVEMPKDKSATGQHEMFSVFVPASGARVSINGRSVASGRPFPRDVAGKTSSTAFLAFSETWVRR